MPNKYYKVEMPKKEKKADKKKVEVQPAVINDPEERAEHEKGQKKE
jgi:hypothetical protein